MRTRRSRSVSLAGPSVRPFVRPAAPISPAANFPGKTMQPWLMPPRDHKSSVPPSSPFPFRLFCMTTDVKASEQCCQRVRYAPRDRQRGQGGSINRAIKSRTLNSRGHAVAWTAWIRNGGGKQRQWYSTRISDLGYAITFEYALLWKMLFLGH